VATVGYDVELILARELAGCISTPVFIVDPAGTLIYFNEPAEALLGRRFDETGEMPVEEWATIFHPTDAHGAPLAPEELPLNQALRDRVPAMGSMHIDALDGHGRELHVAAIPIAGRSGGLLGAAALFWEKRA
jgi:PAS domain-containing protein